MQKVGELPENAPFAKPYLRRMSSPKRILVSPLDWGLGHATRMIPVVQALLDAGADVLLGASGKGALVLQEAFPALQLLPPC